MKTLAFLGLAGLTALAQSAPPEVKKEIKAFHDDFEAGHFDKWDTHQGAHKDSLQVVEEQARRGRHAAKFTVRPGDFVSNGNRAEITHDNRDWPGQEGWYAWSFMVPADFEDTEWRPKLWQCVGQWHDQPIPERGETWATFPGHSPSIALYYKAEKGVSYLELWHGPKQEQDIVGKLPFKKGEWVDVIFHIHWAADEKGFVEAWLNGKPFINPDGEEHKVFGANMWNAYPHFLKIGLYRTKQVTTTNSVYYDEVRIGNSYEEVALTPRQAP